MNEDNMVKKDPFGKSPMSEVYGYKNSSNDLGPEKKSEPNKNFVKKSPFFVPPFIWEFLKILIIAVVIVLPIRYFLFQPFIVKGDSMVPNFHENDYLIVDEISYRIVKPQRGDVVVLKYPLDTSQRFIKRIIGLPGEIVQIKNGKVNILKDGQDLLLNEKKYLPDAIATEGNASWTLKNDEYLVLGDNRPFSYDSRRWGVLPKQDIIGKAVFRVFPFSSMTVVRSPSY